MIYTFLVYSQLIKFFYDFHQLKKVFSKKFNKIKKRQQDIIQFLHFFPVKQFVNTKMDNCKNKNGMKMFHNPYRCLKFSGREFFTKS